MLRRNGPVIKPWRSLIQTELQNVYGADCKPPCIHNISRSVHWVVTCVVTLASYIFHNQLDGRWRHLAYPP